MEKKNVEVTLSYDFKVSPYLPKRTRDVIDSYIKCITDYSQGVSEAITEAMKNDLDIPMTVDGKRIITPISDSNKEAIRDYINRTCRDKIARKTVYDPLFGEGFDVTSKNSYYLASATYQYVIPKYFSRLTQIETSKDIKKEKADEEKAALWAVIRELDTMKGDDFASHIAKKTSRKSCKNPAELAEILNEYNEHKDIIGEIYQSHVKGMLGSVYMVFGDACKSAEYIKSTGVLSKKPHLESMVLSALSTFTDEMLRECGENALKQAALDEYVKLKFHTKSSFKRNLHWTIKSKNDKLKSRRDEYAGATSDTERTKLGLLIEALEFEKGYYKSVLWWFNNNPESVIKEYREMKARKFKEFVDAGGCSFKKPIMYVECDKARGKNKIFHISELGQFEGIDKVFGCRHFVRMPLMQSASGRESKYAGYTAFVGFTDRVSGNTFTLVDADSPGNQVWIPIMVSDRDTRRYKDNIGNLNAMYHIYKYKRGELYVYLQGKFNIEKTVDAVDYPDVMGLDINTKHYLLDAHNPINPMCGDVLSFRHYVNLPALIRKYYIEQGKDAAVREIERSIFLGPNKTDCTHPVFGILSNLYYSCIPDGNGGWKLVSRLHRGRKGGLMVNKDCYRDAFRHLLEVYGGNPHTSIEYSYVENCMCLRDALFRKFVLDSEYKDAQKKYDLENPDADTREPFTNTETACAIQERRDIATEKITTLTKKILSYACYVLESCGYKAVAMENLDNGSWENRFNYKKVKSFVYNCTEESKQDGVDVKDTVYYKRNIKFFNIADGIVDETHVTLNEAGIEWNSMSYFMNKVPKMLRISSIKDEMNHIATSRGMQMHIVSQELTSRRDSRTGWLPERKEDARPVQEEYYGEFRDVMSADENAARNIGDIIREPGLREKIMKVTPARDFETYRGLQYTPMITGSKRLAEIYGEFYAQQKAKNEKRC